MEGFLSSLQEQRRQKADEFRDLGIDPYPTRAHRTHTTADAIANSTRSRLSGAPESREANYRRRPGRQSPAHGQDGLRPSPRRPW